MADVITDLIARLQSRFGTGMELDEFEREIRGQWGGRWVYVSQRVTQNNRDAAIVEALKAGATQKQVADAFGVSERHVRRIKRTFWG